MSDTFEALKLEFGQFLIEYDSFDTKGNKAAAVRARKNLLEMGKLIRGMRAEIQERKTAG